MNMKDLLSLDAVLELREGDKPRVLKNLAHRAAALLARPHEPIAQALVEREDLGSTALGDGVALPHARIVTLEKPFGLFALLRPAVRFDAIDEKPVDLLFLLLLPEQRPQGHLTAMACVARRLRDPVVAAKLRTARGAASLFALLTEP